MNKSQIRIFYRSSKYRSSVKGPWYWHIEIINTEKDLEAVTKLYGENIKYL